MLGVKTHLDQDTSSGAPETEDLFFSAYKWCLNPILSVEELMIRMKEEAERFPALDLAWQRQESIINIYLFGCAISCAVDDYLARRPWRLTPIGDLFPKFRWLAGLADGLANLPSTVVGAFKFRHVRKWKGEWESFVEEICALLLGEGRVSLVEGLQPMQALFDRLRSMKKTNGLMNERMKINEGFRCQDLTYHDIVNLAQRYLSEVGDKQGRHVVIGARTAGSYIAPLVKTFLQLNGINDISWMTVRPKFGPYGLEKRHLRRLLSPDVKVILVDDYSNTGETFRSMEANVLSCGITGRNITILAPIHPAKTKGNISSNEGTRIIVLDHSDLFVRQVLEPESAQNLLKDLLAHGEAVDVRVTESRSTRVINENLWSHYPDSFQVRLKRVYDVMIRRKNGPAERRRVLAKSVGFGWLGYHAFLAGRELAEFVPGIIGLSNGILFMDWLEGEPLSPDNLPDQVIERIGSYVASRTERLALDADRRSAPPFLSWGWLVILSIFRRVYGNLPGYLKHEVLLKNLLRSISPRPALVDGRMRPSEWLSTRDGLFKIDFEQHNFGAPELDVVDPAYDIAAACFEFHLTEAEERRLSREYLERSKDKTTLHERIFLYKLLYGTTERRRARLKLVSSGRNETYPELNERFAWSWDFLVFTMNKFSSGLIESLESKGDCKGLFFADIDGIFDTEVFGFPHTTISGLKALALLRANGYEVIPNTGRSVEQVKNYCRVYGFRAGIGEYGGALYDSVRDLEIPLVGSEVLDRLELVRKLLKTKADVFVDPGCRYAVRSYRYTSKGTQGLSRLEGEAILKELGGQNLRVISREADTYFVGKDSGKGKAVEFYKDYSKYSGGMTLAVGDSDEDIPMLREVAQAYAPGNCSREVRKLSAEHRCEIVARPFQKGFLEIAERVTGDLHGHSFEETMSFRRERPFDDFMVSLLTIADAPRSLKLLYLLDRRELGFGIRAR